MDQRAVDTRRVHVAQCLVEEVGLGAMRRQGRALAPQMNLRVDDRHGVSPREMHTRDFPILPPPMVRRRLLTAYAINATLCSERAKWHHEEGESTSARTFIRGETAPRETIVACPAGRRGRVRRLSLPYVCL